MKKIFRTLPFVVLVLLSKSAFAQVVADTPKVHNIVPGLYHLIKGRVIGMNLESLEGVIITNKWTAEKTKTDSHGIYQLSVSTGDTITFECLRHSKEIRIIKHPKPVLNVILIKRKADELPLNSSPSDLKKAERADEEFYSILEKDAKLEGKWNY
jgi:hypothetical protein